MTLRKTRYGIAELAEAGGVNRRTVRYYVQKGVIPAPLGTGRGKHYTSDHLDALLRARRLQEQGASLTELAQPHELSRYTGKITATPEPTFPTQSGRPCVRFELADGVELMVTEFTPMRGEQLEHTVEAVRRILGGIHD